MENTLLTRVKKYIILSCNITEEEYKLDIRKYLKQVFKNLRSSNNEVVKLRIKRIKLRQDIDDIECSMVGGELREPSEEGKNTGGKKNPPDFKMIQKLQLKEELGQLVNETLLLEKSLNDNNQMMLDFIHMLKNKNMQIILELTYIDGMTNGKIANQMMYSTEYVDIFRSRALKKLSEILDLFEKNEFV